MKRILLLLFLSAGLVAKAQVYNNEWIDYSKTYYKFYLREDVTNRGLHRIPQSLLAANGLGNVPAEQFQLWRDGQQVPVYTSIPTGVFGSSDYIEFWGLHNNGKPEKVMYRSPEFQLDDEYSLQTDTASYFLTVNPVIASNLRLTTVVNDVAGNVLTPEPYLNYTLAYHAKERLNEGFAAIVGEYVLSSAYDQGEGWSTREIDSSEYYEIQHYDMYPYLGAGAPQPLFRLVAVGDAQNPRRIVTRINGDSIMGTSMDFFDYSRTETPFNLSLINGGQAFVKIYNWSSTTHDRMNIAKYEIVYPRLPNCNNASNFNFDLPANPLGNYIEFTNFNYGGVAPVLYDLTNMKRYVGVISGSGPTALIKFALLPSATARQLVLVSQAPANPKPITALQQRNFVNYLLPANQGNYLIITNSILTQGPNGTNPIENYRAYRASFAGGSYNAKIYMIDQLVDQFAFGIKKHPLSVWNFIRWARAKYSAPLKDIFLMGRAVEYMEYRQNESQPQIEELNLVPTFGSPASDNLFACEPGNEIPQTPIGRLGAITPAEVSLYLTKVQEYEQAQAFSSPLIKDKAWMKNVVHVVGASDPALQSILDNYMNRYSDMIADTLYGGNVNRFSKSSTEAVQQLSSDRITNLFHEGIGLLTYFGHSSTTTLQFNLDEPEAYDNPGKYPVFIALGCNAGNFYTYNPLRFSYKTTLSEKFVFAPERGSIAFMASTHLGIVHYLDIYTTRLYNALGNTKYGQSLGEALNEAIAKVFQLTTQNDFYARFHCEQNTIHGDPALKLNVAPKPDYAIEQAQVKVSPSFISVAESNFRVDAKMFNLGKAPSDSVVVEIKRTYPNGVTEAVYRDTLPGIRYVDSIAYLAPIVGTRDKGLNKITITIDPENKIPELYETNNSVTKDVFIYEDEARPVYPYDMSIVSQQNIKLQVSTANPFSVVKQYNVEIDTTETFSSPSKVTRSLSSPGGWLEFTPGITFRDSTVYYWRVAPVPTSGQPIWNGASFIYLANNEPGFNQSHYYQHAKSSVTREHLIYPDVWDYDTVQNTVFVKNGVWGTAITTEGQLTVAINDDPYMRNTCYYANVFNVIDGRSFKPWVNQVVPGGGLYGSLSPGCAASRKWNFEFNNDSVGRRKARDFLRQIPAGNYVVLRNQIYNTFSQNQYVDKWIADDQVYGVNNTLYSELKNNGVTIIDSFNNVRVFSAVFKRNMPGYGVAQIISAGKFDPINLLATCSSFDSYGETTSPVWGPAKAWKQLKWRGTADAAEDLPKVDVIGVRNDGSEQALFNNLTTAYQDFDISGIDAAVFPYLKLKLKALDTVKYTPYQLRYWRVTYAPVPEGAIAPNVAFRSKDTVEVGEPIDFSIAFKNVSKTAFDSVKVKMTVLDKNNVTHIIPIAKKRPMPFESPGLDTLNLSTIIPTNNLPGKNTIFVEANPDEDQPEQFHFNNFAFRDVYVKPDSLNPLLDVTFDGAHILNRDLVSSKPDILIKLKDEARWMILDDTSLLSVQVRPIRADGSYGATRKYYFNTDTLKFNAPGQAPNPDNTATINFRPMFPVDGEYELVVTGKDKSNNAAGYIEYRVRFQVLNKAMISNMLNYPNPFTTSTAFVFTITGNEIPQNIKIEIMTVTGKIVREITKQELGPLRIGRNITEFKWDGTDQFGQKLANGVYLYRVVTNLNGKALDKYTADDDNTDKYFNKGYGKMVLIR